MSECLCAFATRLGDSKSVVIASIQTLIALLRILQTYWRLTNFTAEDMLRKTKLQAELTWLQNGTEALLVLPQLIQGAVRSYSDCPPVASFSRNIKRAWDEKVTPIYEREFEIERLIAAINRKNKKDTTIQGWIDHLQSFAEALESCGEQ